MRILPSCSLFLSSNCVSIWLPDLLDVCHVHVRGVSLMYGDPCMGGRIFWLSDNAHAYAQTCPSQNCTHTPLDWFLDLHLAADTHAWNP